MLNMNESKDKKSQEYTIKKLETSSHEISNSSQKSQLGNVNIGLDLLTNKDKTKPITEDKKSLLAGLSLSGTRFRLPLKDGEVREPSWSGFIR